MSRRGRDSEVAPFIAKVYELVNNPELDAVIGWAHSPPAGKSTSQLREQIPAFVVWQPDVFAKQILPTFTASSNFCSFVRQVNGYGFRKVSAKLAAFAHPDFVPTEAGLLLKIKRRKAEKRRTSSTAASRASRTRRTPSPPPAPAQSASEVVLLRKTNAVLQDEVATLRAHLEKTRYGFYDAVATLSSLESSSLLSGAAVGLVDTFAKRQLQMLGGKAEDLEAESLAARLASLAIRAYSAGGGGAMEGAQLDPAALQASASSTGFHLTPSPPAPSSAGGAWRLPPPPAPSGHETAPSIPGVTSTMRRHVRAHPSGALRGAVADLPVATAHRSDRETAAPPMKLRRDRTSTGSGGLKHEDSWGRQFPGFPTVPAAVSHLVQPSFGDSAAAAAGQPFTGFAPPLPHGSSKDVPLEQLPAPALGSSGSPWSTPGLGSAADGSAPGMERTDAGTAAAPTGAPTPLGGGADGGRLRRTTSGAAPAAPSLTPGFATAAAAGSTAESAEAQGSGWGNIFASHTVSAKEPDAFGRHVAPVRLGSDLAAAEEDAVLVGMSGSRFMPTGASVAGAGGFAGFAQETLGDLSFDDLNFGIGSPMDAL